LLNTLVKILSALASFLNALAKILPALASFLNALAKILPALASFLNALAKILPAPAGLPAISSYCKLHFIIYKNPRRKREISCRDFTGYG